MSTDKWGLKWEPQSPLSIRNTYTYGLTVLHMEDLFGRSFLDRDGTTTDAEMGQSRICQGKDTGLLKGKLYRGRLHI